MTTSMTATRHNTEQPGPRDLRTASRWAAALILPIGPLAIALVRLVLPYYHASDSKETATDVLNHQGTQSVVLWAAFIGVLTLLPGVLAVARITRSRAPVSTTIGLTLVCAGYLALPWMVSADVLLWSGADAKLDSSTIATLFDHLHPSVGVALGVFVVGHVLGTVFLGVALWRSNLVPRWAAVATAVSQPGHFVAFVILGSAPLDAAAWVLNALGFAMVSLAILHTSDDEWELPPVSAV